MIAHAFQIAIPIICTHYTDISMSVLIVFILSVVALYVIWYLPLYFLRKKGILSLLGWIVLGGYSTQVLFVLLQIFFPFLHACQEGKNYNVVLDIKDSVQYIYSLYSIYVLPLLIVAILFILIIKIVKKLIKFVKSKF